MAFVDFYAAGGAPIAPVAAQAQEQPRARTGHRAHQSGGRAWRRLVTAIAALAVIAVPGFIAARFFDDALLGALAAVLFYAATAPVLSWLGSDRGSRRWTSY